MSFARSGGGTRARELWEYVMLPVRKMIGDLVGLGAVGGVMGELGALVIVLPPLPTVACPLGFNSDPPVWALDSACHPAS